jgi:hypothetical protein
MSKGRKNRGFVPQFNRGRNIPAREHTVPIQQRLNEEKKKMLSVLSLKENLREKVDELFTINLEGIPEGKEPMFFSTAIFSINNANSTIVKIEELPDVDCTGESRTGVSYTWTRAYPKGHWNPMSNPPYYLCCHNNHKCYINPFCYFLFAKCRIFNSIFAEYLSKSLKFFSHLFFNYHIFAS